MLLYQLRCTWWQTLNSCHQDCSEHSRPLSNQRPENVVIRGGPVTLATSVISHGLLLEMQYRLQYRLGPLRGEGVTPWSQHVSRVCYKVSTRLGRSKRPWCTCWRPLEGLGSTMPRFSSIPVWKEVLTLIFYKKRHAHYHRWSIHSILGFCQTCFMHVILAIFG